jgi:steroid delta-isomerase-like uncharacterized protein
MKNTAAAPTSLASQGDASATEATNTAVFRRYCEDVLSGGDLDQIDELMDPDVVHHAAVPGQSPGRAGMREVSEMLRTAFPDFAIVLHDVIAKDDRVAARMTVSGTHRGDLGELPATGRRVEFEELVITRFRDGKLAELWPMPDRLALLTQLGVIDHPA